MWSGKTSYHMGRSSAAARWPPGDTTYRKEGSKSFTLLTVFGKVVQGTPNRREAEIHLNFLLKPQSGSWGRKGLWPVICLKQFSSSLGSSENILTQSRTKKF